MNEPRAWLAQARSDFALGSEIVEDDIAFCHPIAKFQQAIEKSIKGLVVALTAKKILAVHVGRRHEAEPYVSALVRIRRSPGQRTVQNAIQRLFGADIRAQIRSLDLLVPKWPPPGVPPSRNTEYPYQDVQQQWCAPAQADAFSRSEANAFRQLAARVVDGCSRIVSAVERGPH